MTGKLFDEQYRITSEVGSGGMADVFKAYDIKHKQYVALKVIKQEFCNNPQYLRRFRKEAQTVMSLRHKNIVPAYAYGEFEGRSYIVLKFIEGCTLKEYLETSGSLFPKVAVKIIAQVLDALSYAHKAGLVHRDVKPQNIMISTDKVVMLTDFGIAKDSEASTRTYDGCNVIGSVHYISPEQARGENVGIESDIYSAGIVLYEMLAGKPPFAGDGTVQIALKHLTEDVPILNDINPKIPIALSDVVRKAAAKDAANRYSSAEDMKADLLRALREPRKRFVKFNNGSHGAVETIVKMIRPDGMWRIVAPVISMLIMLVAMFIFWYTSVGGTRNNSNLIRVPTLLDLTEDDARSLAEMRDFEIEIAGEIANDEYAIGKVCAQTPSSGVLAEKGSIIKITISVGGETLLMPNLYGIMLEKALDMAPEYGFNIDNSIDYSESGYPDGTIIWQSIPQGTEIMEGDSVKVIVSGAQPSNKIRMPDLTSSGNLREATDSLSDSGITNYWIHYTDEADYECRNGQVISQAPSPGIDIDPDNLRVELFVFSNMEFIEKAEFSQNFVIADESAKVVVTLLSDMGEVVIYETELLKGNQTLPFTAYYRHSGEFTCIIYVNGSEYTRVKKVFV